MNQPNTMLKTLSMILGALALIAGIIGVVMVLAIVLKTGDFFGLLSDRWLGVVSLAVLISLGVFLLSKALSSSHQKPRTDVED